MQDQRKNNGGKRREGRKQTMKSYRVDNDLIELLANKENVNKFVNECIRNGLSSPR